MKPTSSYLTTFYCEGENSTLLRVLDALWIEARDGSRLEFKVILRFNSWAGAQMAAIYAGRVKWSAFYF